MRHLHPAFLAVALLGGCSQERVTGGSTSETSNGVLVQVLDSTGSPAGKVRLRVRPVAFLPGSSPAGNDFQRGILDTSTDDSGRVRLPISTSRLLIEAFGARSAGQARLDSGSEAEARVHLQAPSRLRGRVLLAPGEGRARIQARGMEHAVWSDEDGTFAMDSLPSGEVHLRVWIPSSGRRTARSLRLLPARTSEAGSLRPDFGAYHPTDSVRIFLNTLEGPSATSVAVDRVPILVRLDGSEFPESARPDGADLRVLDREGFEIPFAWDRWFPSTKRAAIWVLVPSVLPRDSMQGFRVTWGDPDAESVARPWSVFSAANGWSGAWDLNHSYRDRAGNSRIEDASSWADDGILQGAPRIDPIDGLRFGKTGLDGLIMAGTGTNLTGDFTVLIRARPERSGVILLGRGDSAWNHGMKEFYLGAAPAPRFLRKAGWQPTFMGWADVDFNAYSVSDRRVDSAAWTLLVARHVVGPGDSGSVEWFVDGTLTTTFHTITTKFEPDRTSDSLMMGARHKTDDRFVGAMAEIWILSRAVSDDWVRLQSECRKEFGGALVRLRH